MEWAFLLKKLISSIIMPLPFGLALGIIGLIFLFRNSYVKAKLLLTLSFFAIFIFSYNPVANLLIRPLEKQYQSIEEADLSIKFALLLGGDFDDRGDEVVELYYQNPNLTIFTSGFEGHRPRPEAEVNKEKLIRLGIPEANIIANSAPKDTIEEAKAMKARIGRQPFYLITSAYHMPRAIRIFEAVGTQPIAAPTGYLEGKSRLNDFADAKEATKSQIAVHEYIGSAYLWIKLHLTEI